MYEIKNQQEFIVISGSDIIDEVEANAICRKVEKLLDLEGQPKRLLLDVRKLNLEDSSFDIFVQYLSKIEVKRVSLILDALIHKLKFKLWKRKYKDFFSIEQFLTIEEGSKWLVKE